MEHLAKNSARHAQNFLRMTVCFFPCQVLNKHGFFLARCLSTLTYCPIFFPGRWGNRNYALDGD